MPVTFVIDLGTSMCSSEYDKFNYYFNAIEKAKQGFSDAQGSEEIRAELLA